MNTKYLKLCQLLKQKGVESRSGKWLASKEFITGCHYTDNQTDDYIEVIGEYLSKNKNKDYPAYDIIDILREARKIFYTNYHNERNTLTYILEETDWMDLYKNEKLINYLISSLKTIC